MPRTSNASRRDWPEAVVAERKIIYVILAAGGAQRMGFAKATEPLAGKSPLERLGHVVEGRAVEIVTNELLKAAVSAMIPWAAVLVNATPLAGMTSSLLVAHRATEPDATLGVLLADKPFVRRDTLELCERTLNAAHACDVLFPVTRGERGHPVYFGPKARARLTEVPAGDTLRAVRDDPSLQHVAVECRDSGILIDLDTPEAWRAAEQRLLSERARERDAHSRA
jgi:molybdenum cofactor cytidylyltransferase